MDELRIGGRNENPFVFSWNTEVDLSGKMILAFGGAGALAETFLYAAASRGARLALVDIYPSDPEKKARFTERFTRIARNISDLCNEDPVILIGDVTDTADVKAVAANVAGRFGRIDIAIDFAGMHHPTFDLFADDVEEMTALFRRVNEINLTGAFIFTAVMAHVMVRQRRGHIIHLCSSGSKASLYGSYGYNAGKHGVAGLVKTAAAQLAPYGVRVNGIAPGTVVTDLNRHLTFSKDGHPTARAKSILAHTPSKRFATAEGVAETLISMCIEQRHLTGNLIFPDDGYIIEGHSWPEGNSALYESPAALDSLYDEIDRMFPPQGAKNGLQ